MVPTLAFFPHCFLPPSPLPVFGTRRRAFGATGPTCAPLGAALLSPRAWGLSCIKLGASSPRGAPALLPWSISASTPCHAPAPTASASHLQAPHMPNLACSLALPRPSAHSSLPSSHPAFFAFLKHTQSFLPPCLADSRNRPRADVHGAGPSLHSDL